MSERYDVVVVGGGNAGFSAAHAARAAGASVLLLEKAPAERAGGNTFFTAAAFRLAHGGLDDLLPILRDSDRARAGEIDLAPYPEADFAADLDRLTRGRCDPELGALLVRESGAAVRWLAELGMPFTLLYERQSYAVGGRRRFWGNLSVGVVGEGVGLVERHAAIARDAGVVVRYDAPVTALSWDERGRVAGVVHAAPGGPRAVGAGAVVLAAGGFQSDPRLRAAYLGPGWDHAKVRGTPTNTGEVLHLALAAGAQAAGHWSGCHAVAWDAGAPETGDRERTNLHTKQSYPLGIVVNSEGQRFVDEGADFRNYTYAKYGAEILRQPGAVAYQLFDAKTAPLLRSGEYTDPGVSRHEATTIRDLARAAGIEPAALEATVGEFNAAVGDAAFDPTVRDGRSAGVRPPKSNWAQALDTPPFLAFPVACGITFTFGGLRVDGDGRVVGPAGEPLPGLHAAGEIVGGLFHHNYPGGSGLTAGTILGRRAGTAAADRSA